MSVTHKNSTRRETIICCVEAPRFEELSMKQLNEFKRLRDFYENQIEKRSRRIKVEIVFPFLRASIEDKNPENFYCNRMYWSNIGGWNIRTSHQTIYKRALKAFHIRRTFILGWSSNKECKHERQYGWSRRPGMVLEKELLWCFKVRRL